MEHFKRILKLNEILKIRIENNINVISQQSLIIFRNEIHDIEDFIQIQKNYSENVSKVCIKLD